MVQNLERSGLELFKYRQGFYSLSRPTKEFYRFVMDDKIRHGGHPVLRWMFNNIYIESDAAGNIKPNKQKSEEKIDGAIGAIMALDLATRNIKRKRKGGILTYDALTDTVSRNGVPIDEPDRKPETHEERTRRLYREMTWDM
jgi:phage terminase large subunit-like protein